MMQHPSRRSGAPSPIPHALGAARLPPPPGFRFRPLATPFAMRVEGRCMEPWVFDGDRVVVDPHATPQDGNVVVVECLERGLLVKFYGVGAKGPYLIAAYEPIYIPLTPRIHVFGVVTAIQMAYPDPHESERWYGYSHDYRLHA